VDVVTRDRRVLAALTGHANLVKALTNAVELRVKEHEEHLVRTVKPNFARLGPKHKGLAGEISKAISAADPERMTDSLDRTGSFTVRAAGHEVVVEKDEVVVEEKLPDTLYSVPGTRFSIYVDLTETEEMLSLGFSREAVRRVQEMRRAAGLQKRDRISLALVVEKGMAERLRPHEKDICHKVGASSLAITEQSPSGASGAYEHSADFKVRGSPFTALFRKA